MVLPQEDLRVALVEVLGADVVPRDELGSRLRVAGHRFASSSMDRQLQFDASFVELADGVAHTPSLLDGVALSLPIDAEDAAEGFVRMHPWLDPIGWWLVKDHPDLLDTAGERLGRLETDAWFLDGVDTDVVLGPDGWLDGLGGRWVSLLVSEGAVVIEKLDEPPVAESGPRAQALLEAFERSAERHVHIPTAGGEPIEVARAKLDHLVLEAVAAGPALFQGAPVAGLVELCEAAGLRYDDRWVVPGDIDPAVVARALDERTCMVRHGANGDDARTILALFDLIDQHADGSTDVPGIANGPLELTPPLLDAFLWRPEMAAAVAAELWLRGGYEEALAFALAALTAHGHDADADADVLGPDADVLGPEGLWGLAWLAAHCHLAGGEIDRGVELLGQVPVNVESVPLLIDRSLVDLVRSDDRSARRLLDRAWNLLDGRPELTLARAHFSAKVDALAGEIHDWAPEPPKASVGRNERCPCGSGRKYKACHLGRELQPIEERAAWLEARMGRFVETVHADRLAQLVDTMLDAMECPGEDDAPFPVRLVAVDVALYEAGLIDRFLEGRQATLRDDEADLVRRWQEVDRRVFEVERSRPGQMSLRDLVSSDQVTVTRLGGPPLARGLILVGRPLPIGDTFRAFGGFISVRPDFAADLIDVLERGDADELVAFIGGANRPPAIKILDGPGGPGGPDDPAGVIDLDLRPRSVGGGSWLAAPG